MNLDLWRPFYKPWDDVWILGRKGIYRGVVIRMYQGGADTNGRGMPTKNPHPMYYVFTLDADKLHSSGNSRRKYSAYVRRTQLVPRHPLETRPLQRLEVIFHEEVTVERLRDYLATFVRRGPEEGPGDGAVAGLQ